MSTRPARPSTGRARNTRGAGARSEVRGGAGTRSEVRGGASTRSEVRGAKPRRLRARSQVQPNSVRGRRLRRPHPLQSNQQARRRAALLLMLVLLGASIVKLTFVQLLNADKYVAKAEAARTRTVQLPATRGAITDRNGAVLAFTVEGRTLAIRPDRFADDIQREEVADIIVNTLSGSAAGADLTKAKLLELMRSGKQYVYVARNLTPAQGDYIQEQVRKPLLNDRLGLRTIKAKDAALNAVSLERQSIRQYPNRGIADGVLGKTGWNEHGQSGIESRFDATLAGSNGTRDVEVDGKGNAIPGTIRNVTEPVQGTHLQLTLGIDQQYTGQQMLKSVVDATQAKGGMLLALSVADAHVLVSASYLAGKSFAEAANKPIIDEIEPGSVFKAVTFAAALDRGLITPDTVFEVPDKISMGGVTVRDAWSHGTVKMSATGILAKSSNVGTLQIAQQLGEAAFVDQMNKFGIGRRTGVEMNGERAGGYLPWDPDPTKSRWSGSTFANMPIGQGVQVTLLQMASMYQAIAHDGVRIQPTVLKATSNDGVTTPAVANPGVRVMSAETAAALRTMLTATTQDGRDAAHRGTAPQAAIGGYNVAGKTGTAQKVEPSTKRYSTTAFISTFVGMFPAEQPKYVIAIALDEPTVAYQGTLSAAPLFAQFASYLAHSENVPPSPKAAVPRDLYVD